jgi:hypothetical protein
MENRRDKIIAGLEKKAQLKKEIMAQTSAAFSLLKECNAELVQQLQASLKGKVDDIQLSASSKGSFATELRLNDDLLVSFCNVDVFNFETSHPVWKLSYVQKDESLASCGCISIFDFLSSSFQLNRTEDLGYLVARIFINRENHFIVEGRKQLGTLFNNFSDSVMTKQTMMEILEQLVIFSLEYDPLTPGFESVKEVRVADILEASSQSLNQGGKRLGFRFEFENRTS